MARRKPWRRDLKGRWHGASRDGGIDTPQPASAGSVPQFTMVVPLRSQVRLRLSLVHWAYFALLRAQRARFVRPLESKGSLLDSGTTV